MPRKFQKSRSETPYFPVLSLFSEKKQGQTFRNFFGQINRRLKTRIQYAKEGDTAHGSEPNNKERTPPLREESSSRDGGHTGIHRE